MRRSLLHQISRGRRWVVGSLRYGSSTTKVELDGSVRDLIESEELHPKRHPGAMRNVNNPLPDDLQAAMLRTLGDVSKKVLTDESHDFCKYLHGRKPPMEEDEEHSLISQIRGEITEELNVKFEDLNDDLREYYKKVINSKVEQITKQRKYNWQQIDYTRHKGLLYMVARSAREYAINYQVLKELKTRFQYAPKTFFDFGSGVGSVLW
ncbi:hypothetical protein GE061_004853 [Apolygus lucorum]|uniref:Uncharacterized protein n=1 Tax=Apolygus lucorum TaxID=248454 RepID=A0A8S9X0I8_APOLU|nr:hypothetical protein GE061_004853 [Apolygus lucorum]